MRKLFLILAFAALPCRAQWFHNGAVTSQNASPGTQQQGNFNIAGTGKFGAITVGTDSSGINLPTNINFSQTVAIPASTYAIAMKIYDVITSMTATSYRAFVDVESGTSAGNVDDADWMYPGIFGFTHEGSGDIEGITAVTGQITNNGSGHIGTGIGGKFNGAITGSTESIGVWALAGGAAAGASYGIVSEAPRNWFDTSLEVGGSKRAPVATLDVAGDGAFSSLKTTGAAASKKVVCVDVTTGILYASSTGIDCSN